MGYVIVTSPCGACGSIFSYNPHRVPSFDFAAHGVPGFSPGRQPICRPCMDRINANRAKMGLEPHPIAHDAYQAIPEHEL